MEQVDSDKISVVVGPGGKTIRGIIESSGVESVDVTDDGSVSPLSWEVMLTKVLFRMQFELFIRNVLSNFHYIKSSTWCL